jgi:hypothetical protein
VSDQPRDYSSTIMRIAGNLLGGVLNDQVNRDRFSDSKERRMEEVVELAVTMAREIVDEVCAQLNEERAPKEES